MMSAGNCIESLEYEAPTLSLTPPAQPEAFPCAQIYTSLQQGCVHTSDMHVGINGSEEEEAQEPSLSLYAREPDVCGHQGLRPPEQ